MKRSFAFYPIVPQELCQNLVRLISDFNSCISISFLAIFSSSTIWQTL